MRNFRKLISVILAIMMIMTVVPVSATGSAGDGSSETPASPYPAGAIGLFYEDFESGYTLNQNWFEVTTNKISTSTDIIKYSAFDGKWDFQSHLNTQTANTGDSISVVDVSGLNLGGKFSGNALRLYNERANHYGRNYFGFRRNFNGTTGISLTSGEYAGKKLVYEVDVKVTNAELGTYTSEKQEIFLVPSRYQEQIYDYANGQWKSALRLSGNAYRMEMGSSLPNISYHSAQTNNVLNDVISFKFVLDQTANVDVMNVWINGTQFQQTFKANVNNPYSGMTTGDFYPAGFDGQSFDFGSTIYGLWGTANAMEYYIDNLKAYLVDEFEVDSISVNDTAFNPKADKVEFTFTNEIDSTTVSNSVVALLDAQDNEITNGIVSVALKSDNKTIEVQVADTVSALTTYKVKYKGGLKDVYGFGSETAYVSSGSYYVPQTATAVAEFTTCQILALDSASPSAVTNYVQGEDQAITLTFNDELDLTDAELLAAFEVTDANSDPVTVLAPVFGSDKKTVVLQLSTLTLGRGNHTIKSKANTLHNAAGTYADVEYTFGTLDFNAVATETSVDYIPTTDKTVEVNLTVPTTLTNDNIATGFVVKDSGDNVVDGLTATLDATGKVITLQLSGLDVVSGTYTIDVTDALVDATGRTAMLDAVIEVNILQFTSSASENNGFFFRPGDSKDVEIELSIPTVLTNANIASAFTVENESGRAAAGLAVALDDTGKIITLSLNNLVVDEGVYYIKSNDTLKDQAGRTLPEINLMFNVNKKVILFRENFEEGYTLNENWINDDNKVSAGNYSVGNGAWDIQSNNATDSISVVDVSGLNLGGNFSGNALRLYNDAASGYRLGYFSFRRNFNGADGISLTTGDYAGKKLVYEADLVVKNVADSYPNEHQSSFFAVSRNQETIHDYANSGQWKPSFQGSSNGLFRVEEGAWADTSRGPIYMWYNSVSGGHKYEEAGTLKVILDQTGIVDSISVYANGQLLTSTKPDYLSGHKMSGLETSALMPAGYQGQEFNFADTIYGIWGSPSDMEIYMDNFQAYLIDSFKVESVAIEGNSTAFEASTDSVVFTFTGEIDPATINNAVEVYDAAGEKVGTAIRSTTLESGNKVLRVTLAKSLAGESTYKVVLNDNIKDIYGSGIANDYEWYEYPIDDYYPATGGVYSIGGVACKYIPKSGSTGAKMSLSNDNYPAFVDCYVPVPSTANREVEFTTSRKIVVESVTPAVITGYDLGKDQTVTITLAEEISAATNLNEAFTVTDEDGKNITGLAASFGDTTNTIVLQLKGLALGNGKHFIESVDGALANAEGIFANVSIAVSTVDFMVTYAEPGSEVLAEYKQGDSQVVVLGLSSPAAVTSTDISSAFDVYDEDGNVVTGIQATYNANDAAKTNDDTISLQLSGLSLGRGNHTIKTNSNLKDRRGRTLTYEYIFTKLPFKATYEATLSDYEPKTDKEIVINLTYELSDATIADLNKAFVVENAEGLTVSGLAVSASEDKLAIKLQLKDLDISGGEYKITSKSGAIFSTANEELAAISITVDTGSDTAFGSPEGEGAGSGTPLAPGTDFSTVVLLDENFENSTEKAEKGIEFVPSVNWYTSPEKIPSGFGVVKTGAEYRDAKIAVVPDPADPASGNMVLMYETGAYGKDGSLIGTPASTSSGVNYTTLSRDLDNTTATITKDKYTEVSMSSKIYVKSTSMANLPLSNQQLRLSQYIFAAKSSTNSPLTSTNFAKDSSTGNPKFHMYQSGKTSTSNGKTGSFDSVFTTNEWHTMEYVFSVHEFAEDGGAMKGAFNVYVDGRLVSESAFLADNYDTLTGMLVKLVPTDAGGSITVYYDDWKITQSTKFRTHVDIPATNIPEDQDITLTLTKPLDAESVNLITASLTNDDIEDMVVIRDAEGNIVDTVITVASSGDVIEIDPRYGLKYNTEYIVEVLPSIKVNGITQMLKAADGEEYTGVSYPFATAKALNTYIDTESSAASFVASTASGATQDITKATRFAYTMTLSGAHGTNVIAAVAAFTEKEEIIGLEYQLIESGNTQASFDFTTIEGKTGAKSVRMYIWEAKPDGNDRFYMGRLMQLPDEITNK